MISCLNTPIHQNWTSKIFYFIELIFFSDYIGGFLNQYLKPEANQHLYIPLVYNITRISYVHLYICYVCISTYIFHHISKSFISSQSSNPGPVLLDLLGQLHLQGKGLYCTHDDSHNLALRDGLWGVSWQGDPLSRTIMSSWFIRNMLIRKKCCTSCEVVDSTTSGGFLHPKWFQNLLPSTVAPLGWMGSSQTVREWEKRMKETTTFSISGYL